MDDIFSALGDAINAILGQLGQILAFIFQVLLAVGQFLWNVIVEVATFALGALQQAAKVFEAIWNGALKPLIQGILKGVLSLSKFLKQILTPVVKFLKQVSTFIDRIYNHYVRPILRIIRIARVFLTLLRQLGVKWAGKLDAILGQIQADIQRAFLTIKGYINTIVDLLNIISDPSNLLRRPTTLLSLRRVLHAFIRQWTGVPPGFFFPSPSKLAAPGLGFLSSNFDRNNPIDNPPPSYYLAFDGGVPSFDFLQPGDTIADQSVDDVGAEDYFTDGDYPGPDCLDIAGCRDAIISASKGAISGN